MEKPERQFSFEKLTVWQCTQEALLACDAIVAQLPRPYGELSDQLRRASLSMVCNFAEGVGKEGKDQLRFFRIARGSTYESAALVESAIALRLIAPELRAAARQPLLSVAAILTRLILNPSRP